MSVPDQTVATPAVAEPASVEPVVETAEVPAEAAAEQAPASTEPAAESALPTEETTATEPEVSVDDFDWDNWAGDIDALPEAYRGWAQRALAWATTQHEEAMAAAQRREEVISAWMNGVEDPRLAELQGKLETSTSEWESKYNELQQQFEATQGEHKALQESVKAFNDKRTAEIVDQFKTEHGWIFDGGAKEELAGTLVDDGWPLGTVPKAMKLSPKRLEKVRAEFAAIKDASFEVRERFASLLIAGVEADAAAPKKNPSADLVAGSESTPSRAARVDGDPAANADPRLAAVRRAMKKHRRSA